MACPDSSPLELGAIAIQPGGDGFVLQIVDVKGLAHRLALPARSVHELMRVLPRLDAALAQSRAELSTDLVAHGLSDWSVQQTGCEGAIAMSLQNDQRVEQAYLLAHDDAQALQSALADALAAARPALPVLDPSPQPATSASSRARSASQA